MGPHPAVAAIRLAVRRVLHDVLNSHDSALAASSAAPGGALAPLPAPASGGARSAVPGPYLPGPLTGRPHETAQAAPNGPAAAPGSLTAAAPTLTSLNSLSSLDHHTFPASRDTSEAPPGAGPLVLVACSGGADSMALASALAFEAPKLGVRAGGVTVDHGLQHGSGARAAEVVARLRALGLDPVEAVAVDVGGEGGPEAAARTARYTALDAVAEAHGAAAVLLGHTRDDQAETVLLGLARGSGTRSLSGMAATAGPRGRYRRPFLGLDRQTARTACFIQSLPVWDDPHNADPAYTRSRLRQEGLPALEKALGKGVVEALARTAQLSRDDADALDSWAAEAECGVRDDSGALDVARLCALPAAVRRRVLRRAVIAAGSPAGSLFARHIEEVDRLITAWRGQGALNLPGRVGVRRQGGRLVLRQD